MKKLIVNADDLGLSPKINQGVIQAFKDGVVTTASVMVTKEGFEDAVTLIKDNPRLVVGIHIDLDEYFEIDHSRGRIVGYKVSPLPIDEICSKIRQQIETLLSKNIKIDHLSGHHHVHLIKEIFPKVVELMKEYRIQGMRYSRKIMPDPSLYDEFKKILDENDIIYPPYFIEGWYWGNIDEPYTIAELMTHPGYGELWREYELSASCDPRLKAYLREKNIQLITYTDLINEVRMLKNASGNI
jgi:predicted glycoside hydrolase/deacetylase ChbG (UPF0249 family)